MTLRVHSFCCYPATGLRIPNERAWAARWFVWAIKGKSVKGTSMVPALNNWRTTFQLTQATRGQAAAWFASHFIQAAFSTTQGAFTFVPVPGHDCDSPAKVLQCAVGQLAIMICGLHRSWVVDPLLWFKNPVASARQGGPRQAEEVYPHLEIGAAKYPNQRIVLIDDVKTSGGHLRAAKALLSANGLKVQSAICVARTVEQWPDDPFTYAHEELEDFEPDE